MKYLFASLLLCSSVSMHAQQNHFIYIQADNRQPFYVKLDKKLLSSSASGYLIIPKLQDSSYDLSIGFPRNEWPEQKITCNINRSDVGYLLKNFGEKGWGLFNFQTMGLIMAETKANMDSSKTLATTNDPFSNALANVVNDPTIKVAEEVKEDSIAATVPVKKSTTKKDIKAPSKGNGKNVVVNKSKDRISKLLSRKNADSLKMVYVDRVNGNVDTINVIIPISKPGAKAAPRKSDTATVARHIVSNKKPVRKPVAKPDLAKIDKNSIKKAKDTLAAISPEINTVEAKTDVVVETKNPIDSNDAATVNQPAKKLDDIIAEFAKDSIRKNNEEVMLAAEKKKAEDEATQIAEKKRIEDEAEAAVAAEKKKAEEEAALAAEKKKADDDAALAEEKKKIEEDSLVAEKKKADTDAALAAEIKKANDAAALAAEKKKAQDYADSVAQKALVQERPKEDVIPKTISAPTAPAYNCKYVADGDEFMSVRKKMLKGKNDEEMLSYAHQLFLKRCVTTKQVERLAVLLPNDQAKFSLFEEAYHYTVDPELFSSLQAQLSDDSYIKRFKAMLRH